MRFHVDLIFEYPSPAVLQHVEFIERNQYLICLLSSFKANTLLFSIPNNIFNSLYSYIYHQRTCIHRLYTNILHFRMQTISQFYGKWFRREKKVNHGFYLNCHSKAIGNDLRRYAKHSNGNDIYLYGPGNSPASDRQPNTVTVCEIWLMSSHKKI